MIYGNRTKHPSVIVLQWSLTPDDRGGVGLVPLNDSSGECSPLSDNLFPPLSFPFALTGLRTEEGEELGLAWGLSIGTGILSSVKVWIDKPEMSRLKRSISPI